MTSIEHLPKTFKAIAFLGENEPWTPIEVPLRTPKPTELLIKVHASGICASDRFYKEGTWPGLATPRIPGHEIVGRIAALGSDILTRYTGDNARFKLNGLVGVGWNGGYCGYCDMCRIGESWTCRNGGVTGFTQDGGHAEYVYAPESAIVSIPEEALNYASYAELAPLICGGVTVFDSIRTSKWVPGDLCIVQGIGGLGHLAIQYASKLGLKVYAISSGSSKRDLALSLGATGYIDSSTSDPVKEIQALGGAQLIICTAPYSEHVNAILPAIGKCGTVLLLAATVDGDIKISNLLANLNRATFRGFCCGASVDSERCIGFAAMTGIKSIVQEYSLDQFSEAYDGLVDNKARFRNVIVFP
ncbi:GroES-like protein [Cyathus striatus]|nr:GroES-like protein [Cyathus striatus]